MADILPPLQEEPITSLDPEVEEVVLEQTPIENDPYSPEMTDLIGTLGAFASIDSSDQSMDLVKFQQEIDRNKAAIEIGEENALRTELLHQQQALETSQIRDFLVANSAEANADIQAMNDLADLLSEVKEEEDPNHLEKTAFQRIQEFALLHPEQGDTIEVLIRDAESGGSLLGSLENQLARVTEIKRDTDKVSKQITDQSVPAWLLDIVTSIIPTNGITAAKNNIIETSMLDLVGTTRRVTRQRVIDMSEAEYKVKWPLLKQAYIDESAWIGENKQLILANMHGVGHSNNKSENLDNLFDFGSVAFSAGPVFRLISNLTKGRLVNYALNRDLSQKVSMDTLRKAEDDIISSELEGAPILAAKETEQGLDDLAVTAHASTESLVAGEVRRSGAISQFLEASQKAITAVKQALSVNPRLTKEEILEAHKAGKIEAMDRYGKGAVLDFLVRPVEKAKGVIVDQFVMVLGRLDGIGYAKRSHAILAARNRGIFLPSESSVPIKAAEKKVAEAKIALDKADEGTEAAINKINNSKRTPESRVKAVEKVTEKAEKARVAVVKAESTLTKALGSQAKATDEIDKVIGKGTADLVQDGDKQWFITIKSDINEGAYVHKLFKEGETSSDIVNKFIIGHTLKSPASFLPDVLQGRAAKSVFTQAKMESYVEPLISSLRGLSRGERKRVGAVAKQGNIDKEWYTSSEFIVHYTKMHEKRLPSNREILAYYTLKDINDFEYLIRNHSLYTEKAVQGWMTGAVSAPNGIKVGLRNMKKIEEVGSVENALILDVSEDSLIVGKKVGTESLKTRMKNEGLELIQLDKSIVHNKNKVNHILVKKGDLKTKDLEYSQLKYVAGGHRLYKGKYFSKQTVAGSSGGVQYVDNPLTHIVGPTKGTVEAWTTKMEKARVAFIRQKTEKAYFGTADEIIRAANVEEGVVGWKRMIKEGSIIEDTPFQTTFDQQLPLTHSTLKAKDGTIDISFNKFGTQEYLENQHIPYYMKKKGNILKGPQDETAELINPFTAATRAVQQATKSAAYTNYKLNAIQRWMKTYGDLVPKNGMSPVQRFYSNFDVSKIKELDTFQVNEAQVIRSAIKRQIGESTLAQQGVNVALRSLASFAEGGSSNVLRRGTAKTLLNLMDKDPIQALKGFTFDLKLGLFEPSQLIIQTQTIAALTALHPLKAGKFMWDGAWMRYAAVNTNEEMLNYAAKRASMEASEFKTMVKSMRESGVTDINGELIMLDHNATAAIGSAGRTVQSVRSMGRIPFFEAERLNRVYAWRQAWDQLRTGIKNPTNREKLAFGGSKPLSIEEITTKEGLTEMARLTDKFTMNMTSASAAFWQKGALSIPTQFLSYQMRMIENIAPVFLGGSKQWTNWQKAQLFTGQIVLYGATGFPGGRSTLQNILEWTGTEFDPESETDQIAYRAMVGGFWDSFLYGITVGELDVAFSKRAAVGQAMEQVWEKIMGGGYENQTVGQVLGGAPINVLGEVTSDAWDLINTVYQSMAAENSGEIKLSPMLITKLTDNASVGGRLHRWYWVYKANEWRSLESGKVLTSATDIEQIAAILGFQLRDLADASFTADLTRTRKAFIKDQAKLINKIQIEGARLWANGDKEGWRGKMNEIKMWMQVLDSRDREAVIGAARKRPEWRTWVQIQREYWDSVYLNGSTAGQQPAPNTQ